MKMIALAAPAMIEGLMRHPVEGPLIVPDDVADDLHGNDSLTADPVPLDAEADVELVEEIVPPVPARRQRANPD